jgi:hypothetical protein
MTLTIYKADGKGARYTARDLNIVMPTPRTFRVSLTLDVEHALMLPREVIAGRDRVPMDLDIGLDSIFILAENLTVKRIDPCECRITFEFPDGSHDGVEQ